MSRLSKPLFILRAFCLSFILCAAPLLAATDEKPEANDSTVAGEELASQYYSIKLPEGWKVVSAPKEKQGNVNSIFSTDNGDCVVTLVMGPTLGADAPEISSMFAEEFKATTPPKLKDGDYLFSFPQHNSTAQARLSVDGKVFKLITIYGNQQKADNFIATAILPPKPVENNDPATARADNKENLAGESAENKEIDAAKSGGNEKDAAKSGENEKDVAKPAASEKTEKDQSAENKTKNLKAEKETAKKPESYSCQFYTVKLPEGWKAVAPPEEQQGNINALFSTSSGSAAVTLIVGPTLGADAETIASMFAEQFKATSKIKNQDGRYSFSFVQNGTPAKAIVTVSQKEFMLASSHGDEKEIENFYKNALSSENYPDLMPR